MPRKIKLNSCHGCFNIKKKNIGFTSQSTERKECYFKRLLLIPRLIHYTGSIGR